MSQKSGHPGRPSKRAQLAERRARAERAAARKRLWMRAGAGAAAVAVVGGAAFGLLHSGNSAGASAAKPSHASTGAGAVRWAAPSDPSAATKRAGLPMLTTEGTVLHHHVHLDVIVNGRPVTVPAGVGIDEPDQRISPLHTHDTTGVVHIESPEVRDFTLGQFLTEWNVPLTTTRLGDLRTGGGHTLGVYVNGTRVKGDPAAVKLRQHDEIAVVYGTGAPAHVPSAYHFAAGL
ncbi:MAG TPA: hypothetical protein VGL93_24065 [Streptosporangiaceae bacterium]|jgi:hypothetical protein